MNSTGASTGGKTSAARIPTSFFFFGSVRSSFEVWGREKQRVFSTGKLVLCLDSMGGV